MQKTECRTASQAALFSYADFESAFERMLQLQAAARLTPVTAENPQTAAEKSDQLEALLLWLHEDTGLAGRSYGITLAGQTAEAQISRIKHGLNPGTGSPEPAQPLRQNSIALCTLALSQPLSFSVSSTEPSLSRFILSDHVTRAPVAVGLIRHGLRRAQNLHRQALSITRSQREQLNGHAGKVVWFTGLSGAGKSSLANALETELHAQGRRTYVLDGDNIRLGLNKDLGFTAADRVENIRRIAEVARLMHDAGLIVITAFISPFRAERQMARELIGEENFIEVFVDTPLAICEQRDPKGLYKKARSGQLPNMTGITSPYEPPRQPEAVIETGKTDLHAAVQQLLHLL